MTEDNWLITENIFYPYYGRSDVVEFLKRLYNLADWESRDSRVDNAEEEIIMHIHNGDYPDDWIFEDERFQLFDGEDNILLNFISSAIGSLTNPLKLSNRFLSENKINISHNTISKYLSYFEESYILYSANRYDIKGAKYFTTPLKYYFADIGLRNARLNFRQVEETHIMENIIYNDLLRRGFNVDVGIVEYFPGVNGKTIRVQLEVDFVINRGNLRYYIQSAFVINSEEKKEQERNSLKRIDDSFKKIIIVKDNIVPRYDEYGIYYIGIRDFLLNDDVLE